MVLRSSVPAFRLVQLDRAARLTGEAFGCEPGSDEAAAPPQSGRLLWWLAAAVALAGLAVLSLR